MNLETIKKNLETLDKEFQSRYQYDRSGCYGLYNRIQSNLISIISNIKEDDKYLDNIKIELEKYLNSWANEKTCCEDTDGRMHIIEISNTITESFKTI